ncbi:FtsK/SpoIIIE family DNA translocase [Acutalibacter caecimuris]|uniref:FtsK/SpoIIIE family DNA translocase n=1 Tax=Acutalibacter caecimuris TaxID=3093657 RepID=UPI002AC946F3|nr:DNA translocase FtsK 4TM domain-containing protein [Acutalibacter sp. M00118]
MAEQKKAEAKQPTARRRTGENSSGQKRNPSGAKKNTSGGAKRSTSSKSRTIKPTAAEIRQRNQVRAVVLFACAIFLGCLALIEGDSLWKWAHNAILGIFGGWAVLWPVLMIYVAVITTLDRPTGSMSGKVWLTAVIIVLFCATGFIFGGAKISDGLSFFDYISALYRTNAGVGGGVIGGLLGQLLLGVAGKTGAKIIILLLLFVSVMILTGTTLIGLFHTIKKPVDAVSGGIQNARQRREEERYILAQDRANTGIDVPLEPTSSARSTPVDMASLFPPVEPRKKTNQRNEKLDKLQEVFGITPETSGIKPESEPVPELPSESEPVSEETQEPELPVSPVVSENPPIPVQAAGIVSQPEQGSDEDMPLFNETSLEQELKPTSAVATVEQLAQYQAVETQNTYCFPPVTMLAVSPQADHAKETEELQTNGKTLVDTLNSFGVSTRILDICRGPSVTRYEIQPAAGVKISKITNLSDDLALNLAATGVRIEAPIPGKAAVGIEVPNRARSSVRMRDLIQSNAFQTSKGKLSVALGRDIAGQPVVADLARMPHILIAGTTGSGKSVCINSLIISMLYKATPDQVRFLMIDPKAVELTEYNGLPHMLVPVVTDPHKASGALGWAVNEMMKRYKIFSENNVRNLEGYNNLAEAQNYEDENGQPMPAMPQIVIIIDELADLMMAAPKEVEDSICRLAQLARAAGMHLVVATQRPSVDVVTGLIKANIPSRIALTVSTAVDSRTIIDTVGADKLLGNGDMLFAPVGSNKPIRVQGCYVSDDEISSIVQFVKKTKSIDYDEQVIEEIERNAANADNGKTGDEPSGGEVDPMMDEAIKVVVEAGQASTSLLQRRLRLGYARAGRLIDEMEQLGIVGPHEGSKPRQVLMTYTQWLERNMQKPDTPKEE